MVCASDPDPLLVEDRPRGEGDQAPLAECAEAPRLRIPWPYRAEFADSLPPARLSRRTAYLRAHGGRYSSTKRTVARCRAQVPRGLGNHRKPSIRFERPAIASQTARRTMPDEVESGNDSGHLDRVRRREQIRRAGAQ